MIYAETFAIIAALVEKLIELGIYSITEDQVSRFSLGFILKASQQDRTFLRITRESLIEFCDENSDYVRFRRDLNELHIEKGKEDEARKCLMDKYGKDFSSMKLTNGADIIDAAVKYALKNIKNKYR